MNNPAGVLVSLYLSSPLLFSFALLTHRLFLASFVSTVFVFRSHLISICRFVTVQCFCAPRWSRSVGLTSRQHPATCELWYKIWENNRDIPNNARKTNRNKEREGRKSREGVRMGFLEMAPVSRSDNALKPSASALTALLFILFLTLLSASHSPCLCRCRDSRSVNTLHKKALWE